MNLASIHDAILAAGLPLVSVESPDGTAIVLRFSPGATSEQQQQAQTIAAQLAAKPSPNYARFKDLLRGSGLFEKSLQTTDEKAWTVLISTIDSNEPESDAGRLADFQWSLVQVVAGLLLPLSTAQRQQLNSILTDCGFGFQL